MEEKTLRVEVKILDPRLKVWGGLRYQSAMAAGIDLFACLDDPLHLAPGDPPALISAGFALHLADPSIAALILPRSGRGHREGLVLGNLVGLIDPDYTGPILVSAWNRNPPGGASLTIAPGDRFAQMIFVPVLRPCFEEVETFSVPSARGAGGFGSTGG